MACQDDLVFWAGVVMFFIGFAALGLAYRIRKGP